MLKIKDIKIKISPDDPVRSYDYFIDYAVDEINKKYHISKISDIRIASLNIDARNTILYYNLSVIIKAENENKYHHKNIIKYYDDENYLKLKKINKKDYNKKVVIVGMGPSGLFNAYILALAGFNVTILERGKMVEERIKDVDNFFNTGILNTESNVQFGEGGAGTFSDGKLATGISSPYIRYVLETFHNFGAPLNIIYDAKPHIGSDKLQEVMINFRKELLDLGVNINYETKFIDFNNHQVSYIKDNNISHIDYDYLVLAVGHSATDVYELLKTKEVMMEPKNFSCGLRIEHHQEDISKWQYHGIYHNLPSASYKLATHLDDGKSLYSFCMCPGGYVINASSEDKCLVTNGMSNKNRDNVNANAALLVNVDVNDYYHGDILDGIKFQKQLEQKAYNVSSSYKMPVQLLKDFMNHQKTTAIGQIIPSVKPGYVYAEMDDILPDFICDTIRKGIKNFDKNIPGFLCDDAVLTAPETRSSSTITVKRNDDLTATYPNLYVIGEGSGYSGGITSSAVDGIKIALKIIERNEINE